MGKALKYTMGWLLAAWFISSGVAVAILGVSLASAADHWTVAAFFFAIDISFSVGQFVIVALLIERGWLYPRNPPT